MLIDLDRDTFIARYSPLWEHSPWITAAAWELGPFPDRDTLHGAMTAVVASASREQQLALLNAHPPLAVAVTTSLTTHSSQEQAGAGLNHCSPEDYVRFQDLNHHYRERFGFPFIIAVAGLDRQRILAALEQRLQRETETERRQALSEVFRITRLRLAAT